MTERIRAFAPGAADALWEALLVRAEAYGRLGQYEHQREDLSAVVRHANGDFRENALNNRGAMELQQNQFVLAIQDFNRALDSRSDFAAALANRGAAYVALGQYRRALRDLDRAIAVSPRLSQALSNRARVHLELEEYRLAIQDADASLRVSRRPIALMIRGIARMQTHDILRGSADVAAAKVLEPSIAKAFVRFGVTQ